MYVVVRTSMIMFRVVVNAATKFNKIFFLFCYIVEDQIQTKKVVQ